MVLGRYFSLTLLMVTMFTGGYFCYFALALTLFGLISRFRKLSSIFSKIFLNNFSDSLIVVIEHYGDLENSSSVSAWSFSLEKYTPSLEHQWQRFLH
jgi:hypothetical protein